jgi:hypothetical protein
VAVLALAYGIALAGSGVHTLINADGERGQVFAGASDLFFAALALLIAVGAYRVSRWAWVLFMSWAVWGLTLNLLRVFFFDDPQYLPLALATLAVFLLTPLDIQVAFRVRHPPNVRLHTRSRNPIDSH